MRCPEADLNRVRKGAVCSMGGTIVRQADIQEALSQLGVEKGDTALVHSSLRSFGYVEGGPQVVIDAFGAVLGKEGTLVMPTLCQVDFANSYRTWYMDKPSDVGYLTEYFRKQVYVYRSDHPTHSVAARGKLAYELTHEHTAYGPHICPFGDGAFADSSPWAKMYQQNAKIVFIGVDLRYNTMKHLVEGRWMETLLGRIPDEGERARLRAKLCVFGKGGLWPHHSGAVVQRELEAQGRVRKAKCGEALLLCVEARETMDAWYDILSSEPEKFVSEEMLDWIRACECAAR